MILPMACVRLLGPREQLDRTLEILQDFGRLQIERVPRAAGLKPVERDVRATREETYVRKLLDDATVALTLLAVPNEPRAPQPAAPDRATLARWVRTAARSRQTAEEFHDRRQALLDEKILLGRYAEFLEAFRGLLTQLADASHLDVYGVTLPAADRDRLDQLAEALREDLGVDALVHGRPLASGDVAVLIAVPRVARTKIERALSSARLPEVPMPPGYEGESLAEAAPRLLARVDAIPHELAALDDQQRELRRRDGDDLLMIQAAATDRLATAAAAELSALTTHAFAIDGWLPEADVPELRRCVQHRLGSEVVVEQLGREEWSHRQPPVVLSNPPLFRPFEALTGLLPLPRYGTIDPTPFLAIGFPMLFGVILGDIGYGVVLGALAILIRVRSRESPTWSTIARVALPCALFSIVFGALYGELFGSAGQQWLGLRPLLFDREQAVMAALFVAIGVGLVHTALGLVLGMLASRTSNRAVLSRGVQLVMMILIVLALLSAVHVLPSRLFSPFAIAALVGFPILLLLEGILAPIEFLSTLSSVLSYVRIMALGTASVLLAVVANSMIGLFGSALVGILFGILFHLVNFALGVFSPTIHALRLHYVEFFRQFYSPGGARYEPFRHKARPMSTALSARGPQ